MDTAEGPPRRVRYLWMQPGVRGYLALVLGIPLAGNINVVSTVYTILRSIPVRSSVSPLRGLAVMMAMIALMTALFGLPLGIVTAVRWRAERVLLISGIGASLLSLTPYLVGTAFFRWYASVRGLVVSL